MPGGVQQALTAMYATPIGPKLLEMPEEKQRDFNDALVRKATAATADGVTMGRMAAYILKAVKA